MMYPQTTILGLAGSLRQQSYNRGLLHAARAVAPNHVTLRLVDLAAVPLFNEDLERDGDPPAVRALKTRMAAADAVLIATPEYNAGIPGVLKNALDWASRTGAEGPSVLWHKPIALMGATPGRSGTSGAQRALRQVLSATHSYVLPTPEVLIARAFERFTADGTLHDATTRQAVRALVEALVASTQQGRPGPTHVASDEVAESAGESVLAMTG